MQYLGGWWRRNDISTSLPERLSCGTPLGKHHHGWHLHQRYLCVMMPQLSIFPQPHSKSLAIEDGKLDKVMPSK